MDSKVMLHYHKEMCNFALAKLRTPPHTQTLYNDFQFIMALKKRQMRKSADQLNNCMPMLKR